MSASWSGSMRGPWVKTPFLLLLILLSALSGTVLCQDDGGDPSTETGEEVVSEEEVVPEEVPAEEAAPEEEANGDEETPVSPADPDATPTMVSADEGVSAPAEPDAEQNTFSTESEGSKGRDISLNNDTTSSPVEEGLSTIIILIPVVLVVVIISMIVCGIFINRRWNKKASNPELGKEDPYLDGDGNSTEKVPMPMFEEDVPSVLELEMEELDQWMKNDGEAAEDSKHA